MLTESQIVFTIHLENIEEMRKLSRILRMFLEEVESIDLNDRAFAEELRRDIEFRLPK